MKRRLFVFLFFVMAATLVIAEKPLAPATIVVFNQDVVESVELARFYAQKRGIAREHLVGLSISKTEEIGRDEYDTMIRDPLRAVFKARGWWTLNEPRGGPITVVSNSIRFVAIIKGVPLKIRATPIIPAINRAALRLEIGTTPRSILKLRPSARFPIRSRDQYRIPISRATARLPKRRILPFSSFVAWMLRKSRRSAA
jgi:TIGR03790 family protein